MRLLRIARLDDAAAQPGGDPPRVRPYAMPEWLRSKAQAVSGRPNRYVHFETLPTIDGGHDVIDSETGRTVAHRATKRSANGVAYLLNGAAAQGPGALARALGVRRQSR